MIASSKKIKQRSPPHHPKVRLPLPKIKQRSPLNIQNTTIATSPKLNSDRYSTPKIFYSSRALPIFEKFK
jgi:hypothetical protein